MPLQMITRPGAFAVPYTILLGTTDEVHPSAIFAHWNGAAAAGAFLPCVSYYTQDGLLFARSFPSTAVAAGASADVSYFPGPGLGGATATASTSGLVQVYVDTPDTSANAFAGNTLSNGFTNVRRLIPLIAHGGTGFWTGAVRVPANYSSTPVIKLSGLVNSTTGVVRLIVGTSSIANGSSEDTALVDETAQNITVPGTALRRFDTSFSVTGSTPAAGVDLNIRVKRDGGNVADTCTAHYQLWACTFEYTTT